MSEAEPRTDSHTHPTALLDDKGTVYRSPQKRRRLSSTQQDSTASPPTTPAMDPGPKSTPANSDQTLPSEPAEQPPSTPTPPVPAWSLLRAPRSNTAEPCEPRLPWGVIASPYRDDTPHLYSLELLDSGIEHFASTYYMDTAWESLDQSTKEEFLSWAPDAPKLCSMEKGSIYLFKSWIWRILVKSVFMGKCPDLIEWTSPYFKAQNDMENAILDDNPQIATRNPSTWNVWKYLSSRIFREGSLTIPDSEIFPHHRIKPACISNIIIRGLGSNFPDELSADARPPFLPEISKRVVEIDTSFNNTIAELRFLFHHPDNMKTSGFAFEPEIRGLLGGAMINVDCWGVYDDKHGRDTLERQYEFGSPGLPVDFIVSPIVTCRQFHTCHELTRVQYSMTVCVNWVAEWEQEMEERKEEEKQKDHEK